MNNIDTTRSQSRAPFLVLSERQIVVILSLFIAIKVLIIFGYTLHREFIIDEFSQAYKARLIGQFYDSYIPIKNVLYAYVYSIPAYFTENSVRITEFARYLSFAMMSVTLIVTYFAAMKLYHRRIFALFSVVVVLSVSSFTEHAFRIRSETVSIMFASIACYVLLLSAGETRRVYKYDLGTGVLLGLAFLSTQKAVYYVLALGFASLFCSMQVRQNLKSCVVMAAGFLITFLFYVLLLNPTDPLVVVSAIFKQPMDVALNADNYYSSLAEYKVRSFYRNPISYLIAALAIICGFIKWRSISQPIRCVLVALTIMLLLIYHHNQPWPYVFVMFMPLLGLMAVYPFYQRFILTTESSASSENGTYIPFVLAVLTLMLSAGFFRNVEYLQNDNMHQKELISIAEKQLLPNETYLDGAGMLVSRDRTAPHIGLDAMTSARVKADLDKGETKYLDQLWAENPKIILLNYRTLNLLDLMRGQVDQLYVALHPNIMVAGKCSESGDPIQYSNAWAGEYQIYTAGGVLHQDAPIVNEVPVAQKFRLQRGAFSIATTENKPFCIFPADLDWSDLHYPPQRPVRLFAHMYE